MKKLLIIGLLVCLYMIFPGSAQPEDESPLINLMIDSDVPPLPTDSQGKEAEKQLDAILNEIDRSKLSATIFATRDAVGSYVRMRLTRIGTDPRFELAISGNNSKEMLSTKPYDEQEDILRESKTWVEACRICGVNEINAKGFLPPGFDQNKDTYKALDELGIEYNAGYQAGLIYEPGHEKDVWPYEVKGYKFYAVPISTYSLSGELVPMHDKYFNDSGLSSSQWYDALEGKFEEARGKEQPMAILLTSSVSGSGDYLDSMKQFLNFAIKNNATFVTTIDLVNMTRGDDYVPIKTASKECVDCEDKENSVEIGIKVVSDNATNNESAESTAFS